jgi:hypothetical protein
MDAVSEYNQNTIAYKMKTSNRFSEVLDFKDMTFLHGTIDIISMTANLSSLCAASSMLQLGNKKKTD